MSTEHEHEHEYPDGWMVSAGPDEDQIAPSGKWHKVHGEMTAWRFCPVCGLLLVDSGYAGDEPQCSGCKRPMDACPCACLHNSPTS